MNNLNEKIQLCEYSRYEERRREFSFFQFPRLVQFLWRGSLFLLLKHLLEIKYKQSFRS